MGISTNYQVKPGYYSLPSVKSEQKMDETSVHTPVIIVDSTDEKVQHVSINELIDTVRSHRSQRRMTLTNSSSYEGQLKDDMPHGFGIMTYPSNNKDGKTSYEGEFQDGYRHGKGVLIWNNGDRFEGRFVMGAKDGYGEYTFKNGNIFKGLFKNDLMHGQGIYYIFGSNQKIEGEYKNGKIWNGYSYIDYLNNPQLKIKYKNGKVKENCSVM